MRWCSSMVVPAKDSFPSSGKRPLSIALVWSRICIRTRGNMRCGIGMAGAGCGESKVVCKACDMDFEKAVGFNAGANRVFGLDFLNFAREEVLGKCGGVAFFGKRIGRMKGNRSQRAADHGLTMRAHFFAGEGAKDGHSFANDAWRHG